jgi:hypothetical protein
MNHSQINEFVKDPESMRLFQQERIILEVTEKICDVLEQKNMNRVQLASALSKSKGYISQLLDGSANMTLRTMSDVFLALGLKACVRTQPLYPCAAPRLTLVHDDSVVWGWQNQLAQDVPQQSPHPVPTGAFDNDYIAA